MVKDCPEKECKYAPARGFMADAARETERTLTSFRGPVYLALILAGGLLTRQTGHPMWWLPPLTCTIVGLTSIIPWIRLLMRKELSVHQGYWAVGGDLVATFAIQFEIAHFTPEYEHFAITNLVGFLIITVATCGIRMDKLLSMSATVLALIGYGVYLYYFPGVGRIYFFFPIIMAGWFAQQTSDIMRRAAERDALARFLPGQVAERIAQNPEALRLGGESLLVTVMFTDLRGFTGLAAGREPEEVMDLLNAVHRIKLEAVFAEGGTVNKFMGDGMMAVYGAPEPHPDPTGAALRAAKAIKEGIDQLSCELAVQLRVGVGIHRGKVVAGNLGSMLQLEYTVVGDTVNVASRLEALCKEYKEDILLSAEAAEDLGGIVPLKRLGEAVLRGHPHPMQILAPEPEALPLPSLDPA